MERVHCNAAMDKGTAALVIYLGILAVGFDTSYGQSCSYGKVIKNICYTIVREMKSYSDAETYCRENDGYLASIRDQTTQEALKNFADANLFSIPEAWIGAKESLTLQDDRIWKSVSDYILAFNQGCYKDSPVNRDLPFSLSLSSFTVQKCIDGCSSRGYKYAGLQNGIMCFCGNRFGTYGNGTGCTVPCSQPVDNQAVPYCGGENLNTIIRLNGSYIRWGYNQPNNHGNYQLCGALDMDLETKVADEYCYKQYRYICQHPNKADCSGGESNGINGIYYTGQDTKMCYFVSSDAVSNWYVARHNCMNIQGSLVTVNTSQIQGELKHLIENVITADSLVTSKKLWIGLRRSGWTWETGHPFIYTNWASNEPNSPIDHCVMMTQSKNFMWEDRPCGANAYFVCQGGNIPQPTTNAPTVPSEASTSLTTTVGIDQTPSAGQQTSNSTLSTEEIILLVVVLVLFVIGVIIFSIIIYFCCKRKSRRVDTSKNDQRNIIAGPHSQRSISSAYSNEFIDINDKTDYYSGSAISYRY